MDLSKNRKKHFIRILTNGPYDKAKLSKEEELKEMDRLRYLTDRGFIICYFGCNGYMFDRVTDEGDDLLSHLKRDISKPRAFCLSLAFLFKKFWWTILAIGGFLLWLKKMEIL